MINPSRVATRWLQAGMLQAPPAMIEDIMGWVGAVLAADKLDGIDQQVVEAKQFRRKHSKRLQPILEAAGALEGVLGTAPSLALYKAYKTLWDLKVSHLGYGMLRELPYKQFTGLKDKAKRESLEHVLADQIAEMRELVEGHLALGEQQLVELGKERRAILKYHDPSVKGLRGGAAVTTKIPANLKGWRYGEDFVERVQANHLRIIAPMLEGVGVEYKDFIKDVLNTAKTIWNDIRVTIEPSKRGQTWAASWHPALKALKLHVPNRAGLKGMRESMRESLEHELQHMGQTLMTEALETATGEIRKQIEYTDSKKRRLPSPGMPSRHIMTPQWNDQQGGGS